MPRMNPRVAERPLLRRYAPDPEREIEALKVALGIRDTRGSVGQRPWEGGRLRTGQVAKAVGEPGEGARGHAVGTSR